jgi:hypothetical protein
VIINAALPTTARRATTPTSASSTTQACVHSASAASRRGLRRTMDRKHDSR